LTSAASSPEMPHIDVLLFFFYAHRDQNVTRGGKARFSIFDFVATCA